MDANMSNDKPLVVVKEEITLNKFEGDLLVERITLVDGVIVDREYFDKEGGITHGSN